MLQFWQKIIHIKKESKQCALMEIWKHQHCQIKSCICYHHYFHCIAFVWWTNCQVCGQADLSLQVIVHNCTMHNCTIAQLHMCIGAAVAYRYIGENATLQRSSWDWSVFNGVEHLRSVFNSAACGDKVKTSLLYQSKCNLSMMHNCAKLWRSLISIDIINNWCLNHCHRHCLKE